MIERWSTLLAGLVLWLVFSGVAVAKPPSPTAGEITNPTPGQSQWRNYTNGNIIKAIAVTTEAIWAATEEGVVRWSRADGSYIKYTTADGLASDTVWAVAIDPAGSAWFGTDSGVSVLTPSSDQANHSPTWRTYTTADGLAGDNVRAIAVDREGNLWFGTFDRGVSRLAADGQSWTTYTTADGLMDNAIEAITVDDQGHIWMVTRGGISEFIPPGSTTGAGKPAELGHAGPAAEEAHPPACDYSFPNHTDFRLATVTNQEERVYFYSGGQGCPEGQNCRREAYVIPGDMLMISNHYRGWVCVWYEPVQGAPTVGWLETASLDIQPAAANPPEQAWLGTWQDGPENTITIQQDEARSLAVSGEAYWQGSVAGTVNTGHFSGPAWLRGNHLVVVDENFSPCIVSMDLVGPYLIVRDTHQCGGMNVVFDGVYQKRDLP